MKSSPSAFKSQARFNCKHPGAQNTEDQIQNYVEDCCMLYQDSTALSHQRGGGGGRTRANSLWFGLVVNGRRQTRLLASMYAGAGQRPNLRASPLIEMV